VITGKNGSFTAVKVPFCDYGPKTYRKRIRFDRPGHRIANGVVRFDLPSVSCSGFYMDKNLIDTNKRKITQIERYGLDTVRKRPRFDRPG